MLHPTRWHNLRRRRQAATRTAAAVLALAVAAASLASAAAASETSVQAGSGAFSDDDDSVHEAGLDAVAARGYLEGTECGDGRICPSQPLKRWEMAVWLGRALSYGEPGDLDESRFADVVAKEWWAPHVDRFSDLGVTTGCATEPLRYCPDRSVTRAEMATFFTRAFRLPDDVTAGFTDTAGNTHMDNIDALAAEGITVGCASEPLRYCPDRSVTRAEMATFLSRALGLIPLPTAEPLSAQEVYAKVAPSIPIIESAYGHGSGILIPGDYVLTNHHVVWPNEFDDTATILFPDGTEYVDVPVVATNPWADLAVLGPLETDKRPLPLADGEQLPPGSDLYLIGYPAEYESAPEPTITRGLLSRVRHWDGYNHTLLQTDAAITGGQSGGALVDGHGRVVGVSTWTWSDAGFGVATSASDDAVTVDLMLTDSRHRLSFLERLDPEASPSREWDIELAGSWDAATFVVEEYIDTIDLEVDSTSEASLWMANAFEARIGPDAEGGHVNSGSVEIDFNDTYFVNVANWSAAAASYTLTSSASLLPYYDEDGHVLLGDDVTPFVENRYAVAGAFDYFGDWDAYEVQLRRGETVVIWTDSILTDTALLLYDSASNVVAEDDDSGPIGPLGFQWNAQVSFEAPATSSYYVAVWTPDESRGGSYIINAEILDGPDRGEDVVIAGRANWTAGYFQAELYKLLLEELGYNVSDPSELELHPSNGYTAMAQGYMDYWPNSWYPAHLGWLEAELPDGSLVGDHVTVVGEEMIQGGMQGFVVTKSFADEYGVYTMDDLNSNADALAAFDATDPVPGNGVADIFGCPEYWTCDNIIENMIAFSGWDNIAQITADYDAMFAQAVDRANEGVPMVAFTWAPSAYITRLWPGFNVYVMGMNKVLDDSNPADQPEGELHDQRGPDGSGGFAAIGPDQCPSAAVTDDGKCPIGWLVNDILVTARNEFLEANPVAEALFEAVRLPVFDVLGNVELQHLGGWNPTDLAIQWIADNRDLVDEWLAAARAAA